MSNILEKKPNISFLNSLIIRRNISYQNLSRKVILLIKDILFKIKPTNINTKKALLLGHGRSGTDIVINLFQRDLRIEALDEESKVMNNFQLDFDSYNLSAKVSPADIFIVKSVHNPFQVNNFITDNRNKVIWVYRNYKDQVNSRINQSGYEYSNFIKDYMLYNKKDNWYSENIPDEIEGIIKKYDYINFSDIDWLGILWWSVHYTIIHYNLCKNGNFTIVSYESLARKPEFHLKRVYLHLGLKLQNKSYKYIHNKAMNKGSHLHFSPTVEKLCNELDNYLRKNFPICFL